MKPVFQFLSSLKITIACLALLFVLTLWGTVYQVEHGIYYAQEKFFHSFFFPAFGPIPFPGARLVLWILFINLLCVTLIRFVHYSRKQAGILIIHFGLLTYFLGAFVTFHVTQETYLNLMEGQGSNVSASYRDHEISIWKETGDKKRVTAINTSGMRAGQMIDLKKLPFTLRVESYYENAQAYTTEGGAESSPYLNAAGITSITRVKPDKEPEKNMAAGTFVIDPVEGGDVKLLLFAGERNPTQVNINGENYYFQLRKKRMLLPMTVVLDDFIREMHPGTDTPKSFKSWVTIDPHGITRKVLIYMNHPLRHKDFTFYQASYAFDRLGREYSTFAVVKNPGRVLPYISSLLVTAGLIIHFLGYAFKKGQRDKGEKG